MRHLFVVKLFLLSTFFISSLGGFSQHLIADTSGETASVQSALNLYHSFLSPETGLYNGSEYTYNAYYPFTINEGDPFFQSKEFYTGTVFYNNVLYKNVLLLFDIIKGELLIRDPSRIYIIKLHTEKIGWFTIWSHTFIRVLADSINSPVLNPGFYDLLYDGNTALLKKVTKTLKENSASIEGINDYVVESDEYFIKKNNRYYRIKNRKSLLLILKDHKKDVEQFVKKNKLNFKNNTDDAFKKTLAYYDEIDDNTSKAH